MTTQDLARLISRHQRRPRTALPFLGALALARGRVHEFCGPARRTLALMAARGMEKRGTEGTVLWLRPGWLPERLFPEGVLSFLEPGRIIFVTPRRPEDLLWCFEESLRGGAAALVVAELPEPPHLTPVRRLQLAAETGAEEGAVTPTGLMLTPGRGGAPGVETRWHLAPGHTHRETRWQLDRLRARADPPQSWIISARADSPDFTLARMKPADHIAPGQAASSRGNDGPETG